VRVRIDGIVDDAANPAVTSSWTISLEAGQRAFGLATHDPTTAGCAGR